VPYKDPEARRATKRKHYDKNRERYRKEARERYRALVATESGKAKINEQRRLAARNWRKNNPEKWAVERNKIRLDRYNLTQEAHDAMLAAQEGRCAICSVEFTGTPHIDHCHASGRVRGLLCGLCNTGLGKFRDNPVFLTRAVSYLQRGSLCTPPAKSAGTAKGS
jgi:hypothetical protein